MPGAGQSDSKGMQYIGLLVFVVALMGWVFFNWNFESSDGLIPVVLAIACVVLVGGVTLYRRYV